MCTATRTLLRGNLGALLRALSTESHRVKTQRQERALEELEWSRAVRGPIRWWKKRDFQKPSGKKKAAKQRVVCLRQKLLSVD
jgi:hypothetical protein